MCCLLISELGILRDRVEPVWLAEDSVLTSVLLASSHDLQTGFGLSILVLGVGCPLYLGIPTVARCCKSAEGLCYFLLGILRCLALSVQNTIVALQLVRLDPRRGWCACSRSASSKDRHRQTSLVCTQM